MRPTYSRGEPYLVTLNFLGVVDHPGAAEYQPVWRHDPRMSGGGVLMDMLHAVYILSWLLGVRAILSDFVDSVEHDHEPIAPGEQGCATLEAVVGAYASAARQENVTLPLDHADPVYHRGISALLD